MKPERIAAILIAAGLAVASLSTANASELTPLLQQAESQYRNGDTQNAAISLRQALIKLYNKSTLKVEKAVLIESRPASRGRYQPRANNRYKSNEPILLYVEPVGYHFVTKSADFSFGVTADLSITDSEGNILGGGKRIWNLAIALIGPPVVRFLYDPDL